MSAKARIAFAGTPEFAVPALRRLVGMDVAVPIVFTQPDRRAGRGRRLASSPVKRCAEAAGLAVAQPAKLTAATQLAQWGSAPDLLVVVAYGLLLPEWMLDWPRLGCVNIHASLLPRWRGAAPIQYALMAGDRESGVTLLQMTAALDAGPVLAQRATPIRAHESAGDLGARLARLGADLLRETLPGILGGSMRAEPQADTGVSYAPKIAKADAAIDWRCAALDLERRVRAFNPWPIAESRLDDGTRLRIWDALALSDAAAAEPATIVAAGRDGIDVATGRGCLRLTRVQAPSKKPVAASVYARSQRLEGRRFAG